MIQNLVQTWVVADVQANFYHCAAYGSPISNTNGGPAPTGCTQGQYSTAVQNLFKELALDEMDHVQGIQTYLGKLSLDNVTMPCANCILPHHECQGMRQDCTFHNSACSEQSLPLLHLCHSVMCDKPADGSVAGVQAQQRWLSLKST